MKCLVHPGKASICVVLMLLLFVSATAVGAFAQDPPAQDPPALDPPTQDTPANAQDTLVSADTPDPLLSEPAQMDPVDTSKDGVLPLVFSVENTGASFPAPIFLSFAQLPIIRTLPDPFVFADGTRDTSFANWERRRNEIKASIEKYEIGPKPDCHDCTITATWTPATAPTRGTLKINVTRNSVTITITTRCYIPSGVTNPIPAVIPMVMSAGSSGLGLGSLPSAAFTGKVIASCDFPHNSVTTYGGPSRTDNFYKLYPEYCSGTTDCTNANFGPSNQGQYAAWSWGVSRIIDGIIIATQQPANPLPIDVSHLMVTGCSYAGKMALFAGAFDERVALTIAQENGGGGAASWRVSQQIEADDVVENLTHTDHNWFASQMWQFQGNNVYKLPHDHHELMAMVAPRALLETGNTDYLWLSNKANYISARATQQIYNTFGIGDRFGFYIDGGHMHCSTLAAEAPVIGAWVDKYLRGITTANTDTEVTPYPTIETGRWRTWWGTSNPAFPNDWNPGNGTVVLSAANPQLGLNFGDTLSAGYALIKPGSHPAATETLNGDAYSDANVQTDISCPDGSSYTLTASLPKQSYSIAANDASWYPSADPASPLGYQGSVANSSTVACNGGVATSCIFSALGTQTTRGAGNAAGQGFTDSDTADPLNVSFHIANNGAGGAWSNPVIVNFQPGVARTVITWAAPPAITYGTALDATQLNATASFDGSAIPGTFTYTPPAGTYLNAGDAQTLSVTFTPSDASKYASATGSVSINVEKANQVISFGPLPDTIYGAAPFTVSAVGGASTSAVAFSATGNCLAGGTNGSLITIVGAGSCTVTASQPGDSNYNAAPDVFQTFTIQQATAKIVASGYSGIYDGQPHGPVGTATGVNGEDLTSFLNLAATFTDVPGGTAAWTFSGNPNYVSTSGTVSIVIAKATPSLSSLTSPTIIAGAPSVTLAGDLNLGTLVPTGTVAITLNGVTQNGAILAGGAFSSSFATASLRPVNPPYTITYAYGGDNNFNGASGTGSLTIGYSVAPLFDQTRSFNGGRTIPIKLELADKFGVNLSSASITVTAVQLVQSSTNASSAVQDSGNANPEGNFRYDATLGPGGGYIFNLSTKGLAPGTWQLSFTASGDPTPHALTFQLQ